MNGPHRPDDVARVAAGSGVAGPAAGDGPVMMLTPTRMMQIANLQHYLDHCDPTPENRERAESKLRRLLEEVTP